jgi:hypothetical protein
MDRVNIYDDIVYRLRTEHERFARVPQENKFMLGPLVHGRLSSLFTESANEIEQLRKQRDEARREICENDPRTISVAAYAKNRGWHCFEEEKTDGK